MNIYEAIHTAMCECGAVGKDSKNPAQGYKYRGIDAVMNAINPALRKAKIFVVPEVLETSREERTNSKGNFLIYSVVRVKYTFFADDGSNVSAFVMGEGMDSGDKSFNKAMSAAFKYALFQVFCIPTEEMVDSEIDSPEVQPRGEKNTNKVVQKEEPAPPQQPATEPHKATAQQLANIQSMANKKGVSKNQILARYKVKDLDCMTYEQASDCIKSLMITEV